MSECDIIIRIANKIINIPLLPILSAKKPKKGVKHAPMIYGIPKYLDDSEDDKPNYLTI